MHDDNQPLVSLYMTAVESVSPLPVLVAQQTASQKLEPVRKLLAIFPDHKAQLRNQLVASRVVSLSRKTLTDSPDGFRSVHEPLLSD